MKKFDTQTPKISMSSRIGALSELLACAWLIGEGYEVFRNVVPCGPADIIAFKGDELIKIDVKTIKLYGDTPLFQRQYTAQAAKVGVEILYVFPDRSCRWARDIDEHIDHDYRRNCACCEKEFMAHRVKQVFCSKRCRNMLNSRRYKIRNKTTSES